jgi:diguanylate cyclase (GGDEF)-like protein
LNGPPAPEDAFRSVRASGTDRFQALCELSQEMTLAEDERTVYRVVLEVARKVLDFFNCAILLVDERTRELVMVDEHGYPPETRGLRLPLDQGRGLSCWVAQHGEILYVPDVLQDDRYVAGVPEARSELAVPIRFQGRTLGVLNVESDRVDAFDRDEALLLQALASQMAVALEARRALAELQRQSITDSLTGAFNRRYLTRLLSAERARAARYDRPIGLLMTDLDDFKSINDRFGHARGDQVLTAAAAALMGAVRQIDSVIRYGGDEFLIVLPETSLEGVGPAAERIRRAVMETLAAGSAVPAGFRVGLSVGTAVHHPGEDLDARLRDADAAMYADKRRRGGGRGPG